jgi:aminodeoxyfutalosine deaminase
MERHFPKVRGAVYAASRLVADADTVVSPGAIAVSGGTVVAAGSPADVAAAVPAGFDRYEFPGAVILPGLVNAHTHLQIPPLAERPGETESRQGSFVDWLLRVIAWRLSAPPETFARNLAAAAAEALAAGTTAAGEIAAPDPGACASLPLRARVFAEAIGFFPEVAPEAASAAEASLRRIAEAAPADGTLLAGLSPHTLYTVGPDLLRRVGEMALREGLPLCLHLAESPAEMTFLADGGGAIADRLYPAIGKDVAWFRGIGMAIPDYLAATGVLREGLVLVHNVHLSRAEIDRLRGGDARFVLCPRSNRVLGNGSPDVTHFVDAGIPFALGTDSLGSVPTLSPWDEMREARSLYRGRLPDEELCRVLFRSVTAHGAAALRLPGGSLAPGSPADFLVVADPGGAAGVAPFRALVERTGASDVLLNAVAGRVRHRRP